MPTLTLEPPTPTAGQPFTLTGAAFASDAPIDIRYNVPGGSRNASHETARSDAVGAFTATLLADAPGDWWLHAEAKGGQQGGEIARLAFTVV
jgi:hypothetical protein